MISNRAPPRSGPQLIMLEKAGLGLVESCLRVPPGSQKPSLPALGDMQASGIQCVRIPHSPSRLA